MKTMSIKRLRQLLSYDPDSGRLTWRIRVHRRVWAGNTAGKILTGTSKGYIAVGIDGAHWSAHRLAWAIFYGRWPRELDHINRNRSDNRIKNLREVSHLENARNCERVIRRGENAIGTARRGKRWQAQISHGKRSIYLGVFATQAEAHAAYLTARAKFGAGQ